MRYKISFLIILFIIASCKTNSNKMAQKLMGNWYKKRIHIPSDLQLISGNSKIDNVLDTNKFNGIIKEKKFIILHYFTADCDKCIDELQIAQKFISQHRNISDVSYIFIACGPTDVYVKEAISKSGFKPAVYYDKKYYGFEELNRFPIGDHLYETMLINEKGELLLFGSVYDNVKAKKLYLDIINEKLSI